MSYDILKAALEKKKQINAPTNKGAKINSKGAPIRDQVTSHKPAKKSAGRGR